MKIAIVGSGIAGLVCAWRLNETHEITVFEANAYIGGHTHTVDVEADDGTHAVDTGFIIFNKRHYPLFSEILRRLGVSSKPTDMSFSVRCDRTGLEYNATSLNRLFAQRRNLLRPRFWRMIREIFRFGREAVDLVRDADEATTVGEFMERHGYSEEFAEHYLIPMGSALWSVPAGGFRRFPIRFVVDFFENHDLLKVGGRPQWLVVEGGSRTYVDAITAGFRDRIRLSTPVTKVKRRRDAVLVTPGDGAAETFDHVILACHADQSLRMLADATDTEREALEAFPYQENDTALHSDESVLPRRRRAHASWNVRVPAKERDRAVVTYGMNSLQGFESKTPYLVTLNDTASIAPDLMIERMTYHHPVYTAGRAKAWARRREFVGASRRTSLAGAYWGYGFHEDGVRSAIEVCEHFGRGL